MKLLAILLPNVYFFLTLRIVRGLIATVLMCTGIGWIPASLWALSVSTEAHTDRKIKNIDRKLSQVAAVTLADRG